MEIRKGKREMKMLAPLVMAALAFLGFGSGVRTLAQDPEPPPSPRQRPKPTPTPATNPKATDDQDEEVVRVSSNLVVVPVSVIDPDGNPVRGLKAADFRLEEAGKPQQITQLGDPDQVPLDIAILFDLSSSVQKQFVFEQEAASRFLKEVLRPSDSATVFAIDSSPRLVQTRGSVENAIATLMSFKPATEATATAFYDTVTVAARYLAQNAPKDHRRVILVISDGDDTNSNDIRDASIAEYKVAKKESDAGTSGDEAVSDARAKHNELHRRAQLKVEATVQQADTVFYSINPSGESIRLNVISTRAENGMEAIANSTGGSAFVPNTDADLERVFRQIATELRAQYLLQYYSENESPTGKFIPITVTLASQNRSHVRARQGYYAKKK